MSLKNTVAGSYSAKPVEWGIEEVEKLDGAIKAVIVFEFLNQAGEPTKIKWDGFLQKRDGEINKKTVDTLLLCGLDGDFLELLPGGSGLDMNKQVLIDVIQDGDYLRVEWVNDPAGAKFIKHAAGSGISKTLKGLSLQAGLKKKTAPKPRNHAPGAEFDPNEEIPF